MRNDPHRDLGPGFQAEETADVDARQDHAWHAGRAARGQCGWSRRRRRATGKPGRDLKAWELWSVVYITTWSHRKVDRNNMI